MSRPRIFLTRMALFVIAVVVVSAVMSDMLAQTFLANPLLN